MKAQTAMLVTENRLHIVGLPVELIVPVFTALGFTPGGTSGPNFAVREEIREMPVFRELHLVGDADGVARYETEEAFRMLTT